MFVYLSEILIFNSYLPTFVVKSARDQIFHVLIFFYQKLKYDNLGRTI